MDTLSYKTRSVSSQQAERTWHLIDAENKVVGRLASEIAKIIRGKNKPSFTPHDNTGDKVVVINADKVRFTGKKMDQKEYIRHTGYPGGQRVTTPTEVLAKKPERILHNAVKGMLPKNKLQKPYLKNLFIYTGTEHPHEAQKPKKLDI